MKDEGCRESSGEGEKDLERRIWRLNEKLNSALK
jgi:hypothetical protein